MDVSNKSSAQLLQKPPSTIGQVFSQNNKENTSFNIPVVKVGTNNVSPQPSKWLQQQAQKTENAEQETSVANTFTTDKPASVAATTQQSATPSLWLQTQAKDEYEVKLAKEKRAAKVADIQQSIDLMQTRLNNLPTELTQAQENQNMLFYQYCVCLSAGMQGGDLMGLSADEYKAELQRRILAHQQAVDQVNHLKGLQSQLEDAITFNQSMLLYEKMNSYEKSLFDNRSFKNLKELMSLGYTEEQIGTLAETLNRQKNAEEAQAKSAGAAEFANKYPVLGTIGSWGAKLAGMFPAAWSAIEQTYERATGKTAYNTADPNDPLYDLNNWGNTVQGTVAGNIAGDKDDPAWWKGARDFLSMGYQAVNSTVDTLAKVGLAKLTGGGSLMVGGLSFVDAMGSDFQANAAAGVTTDKAFLHATVTGALELLTEKYSVDNLLSLKSPTSWKQVLKNAVIQGGVEVTEEELNFVAGIMADSVILGEDINKRTKDLMEAEGISSEEARKRVYAQLMQEAASTAIISFLAGGMSAGATGTVQKIQNNINNKGQQAQSAPQNGNISTQPQTPAATNSPATATPSTGHLAQTEKTAVSKETAVNVTSAGSAITDQNKAKNTLAYTLATNLDTMRDMVPVAQLTGRELNDQRIKLSDQIRNFFKSLGNKVSRNGLGDVELGEYGVGGMLNHRPINRAKIVSVAAVPDVIKNGKQISYDPNWKGRGYESYTFAAPVTVNGTPVYVAAVVNKLPNNKFYLSEMVDSNGNYIRIEESPSGNSKNGLPMGPENQQVRDYAGPEELPEGGNPSAQSAKPTPHFNNSIRQSSANVNPNEAVGAADANFTGKQAYYDLLSDDNVKPGRTGDIRDVEVPETDGYGRRVSDFLTNAVGAEITTDEMADAIQELIGEGALGFDVKSDKSLFQEAADQIKKDKLARSTHNVTTAAMSGKAKDVDIVKAMLLYNIYNSKGNIDNASEVMVDLATMANDAGRKLRLFGLLRKMTPEGQLSVVQKTVQRTVDRINKGRSAKNQAQVTIPAELEQAYEDAARRDSYEHSEESERAKAEAEQEIYKAVAAQIKASPMEKLNAWRYMAMLGNAKTQIRNFAGNAMFRPLVDVKRAVGAAIEHATLEQKDRTKAILGFGKDAKELVSWATEDAKGQTAQDLMSYCGQTGDAAKNAINDNRQIFDSKWLEATREFVQMVPEKADMLFKKREYAVSLASFLKAKGYTTADIQDGKVSEDILNKGRSYAAQEALKATFNDHNTLSDFLVNCRYKGDSKTLKALNILGEGIMPFRRTPANIVVRGLEYGPVGLVRGIGNAAFNVRSGKVSAATAIDQIAGGLTGTGMTALGWALASGIFGIRLRGAVDDEEKLSGHQSWALEIGDQSYDISWLAPSNIPLLVGANLCELSTKDGNEDNWFINLASSSVTALEPMLELSCLSSLNDFIQSAQYSKDGSEIYSLIASAATSYLTQFIPTVLGQVEQAFEDEKKSVYTTADTPLERNLEKTIGRITQKIPVIDLFQTEKVDQWGRTQDQDPVEKVFNAFINPSKVSTIEETDVDRELERLQAAIPDGNVYPGKANKEVSYTDKNGNSVTKVLTAEEYATLAKAQGQLSRELVEKITNAKDYKGLSDAEKANVINLIYDYAAAASKSKVIEDYRGGIPSYIANRAEGMSVAEAIIRQGVLGTTKLYADLPLDQAVYIAGVFDKLEKEEKSDGSSYASVRTIQKVEALADSDLDEDQQRDVMDDILDDSAYEKYVKILSAGYDTDDYAAAYRLYQDTEKTENTTKKEMTIRGFMEELGVSRTEAIKLYDIYAGKDD